jgi:oxygen-dependent protoporphyrinogen oxidase
MWDKAMPQYNLGHPQILRRIDSALEKYPSLALAGNGYRGIGIPDCIHSGELAVDRIFAFEQPALSLSKGSNVETFQPSN